MFHVGPYFVSVVLLCCCAVVGGPFGTVAVSHGAHRNHLTIPLKVTVIEKRTVDRFNFETRNCE